MYSFTLATPSTCTCVFTVNEVFDIKKLREKGAQNPVDPILCGGAHYFRPNYCIFNWHKNVHQFTSIEQTATDDRDVHTSLQYCGSSVWNLLCRPPFLHPKFGGGSSNFKYSWTFPDWRTAHSQFRMVVLQSHSCPVCDGGLSVGERQQELVAAAVVLSRLIHTYHAVPLPCRAAKGLDCVFPIWFTQCGRVLFTHAMPCPCHATTMPFWKRLLKATA
jgi:hypothetical protein